MSSSTVWMGAAAGGSSVQVVKTLEELDRKLAECDQALAISDDALRAEFATFRMDFSGNAPSDPFSDAYRDFQAKLYERIAGKTYTPQNEATSIDTTAGWRRPFPFYTQSTATAGNHLGAVAFLLRSLQLPPGARVLEFGPGWGNTTIALAQLGMKVTAVDIEANFCAVIRARASHEGVAIEIVEGDFFYAESVREPFDAVIFFECFHHCADHLRLLRALHHAVKPDGRVYFAAEPIIADYPVPWGLRVDPEALWAIRRFGWLELGYDEAYFTAALARCGWTADRTTSLDLPWINIWIARRAEPEPPAQAGATTPVRPAPSPVEPAMPAAASVSWTRRLAARLRSFGR